MNKKLVHVFRVTLGNFILVKHTKILLYAGHDFLFKFFCSDIIIQKNLEQLIGALFITLHPVSIDLVQNMSSINLFPIWV